MAGAATSREEAPSGSGRLAPRTDGEGGVGDKRRRKQEKRARRGGRVKRPRSQPSAGKLERELSDPEKFTAHLERFRVLAVEDEALEAFGVPSGELIPILFGTGEGGPAPLPKDGDLSDAVLPHLAEPALAEALSHVLAEAHDAMADRGAPESDLLAVLAATALAEDCVEGPEEGEEPGSEAHPFWGVVFDVAFTRAVGSGALVGHAVADPTTFPAKEALAARLGDALGKEPLRADLAKAKVQPPAPLVLAETLLEVLADDDLVPSFGVETALEGLRVQRRLFDDLVPRLVREGPSKGWTDELRSLAAAAYATDPVGEVVGELRGYLLTALKDSAGEAAEAERLPLVAMLAALDAYPPAESPLLKRAWAQTISTPALDEAEEPLAIAVYQAPTDAGALDALERHLAKSAPERAARLGRFRARHAAR